jgi:hypothetical protein
MAAAKASVWQVFSSFLRFCLSLMLMDYSLQIVRKHANSPEAAFGW